MASDNDLYIKIGERVLRISFVGLRKGIYVYFREDLKSFLTKRGKFHARLRVELSGPVSTGFYTGGEKEFVRKYFKGKAAKFPRRKKELYSADNFFKNAGTEKIKDSLRTGIFSEDELLVSSSDISAYVYNRRKSSGILDIANDSGAGCQIFEIKNAVLLTLAGSLSKAAGIVLHGCGILDGEAGFIALGVSGAGKSTLAGLYGLEGVLADDMLPAIIKRGKIRIFPGPFNQFKGKMPENKGYDTNAILFLKKDKRTFIRDVRKSKTLTGIMKHYVNYLKFYNDKEIKRIFYNVEKAVENIPAYELHFEKNRNFKYLIKEI